MKYNNIKNAIKNYPFLHIFCLFLFRLLTNWLSQIIVFEITIKFDPCLFCYFFNIIFPKVSETKRITSAYQTKTYFVDKYQKCNTKISLNVIFI